LQLDWSAHLPWVAGNLQVECGTMEDALPFIRDHYPAIFGDAPEGWTADPMTPAKLAFLREADVFVIRDRERIAGIMVGHPSDWTSYYVRTLALLPEYRGRQVAAGLLEGLAGPLRAAGVQRLETDVSPANQASMLMHEMLGFTATGMNNHDRWGSLLRFTGYLRDAGESVFHNKFCASGKPHRRRSLLAGATRN
jgi:L-amino acid N-acyltransferase YncA